jgi:gluconolactonase
MPASFEVVYEGFAFIEGINFDRDGNCYFSELETGRVYRATPDGQVRVFLQVQRPNGTTFHPDGTLYVCEMTQRAILAVAPDGGHRVALDRVDGEPLRGPNDLIFDYAGNLFFTDPVGSSAEEPVGRVCRMTPDGQARVFATGLAYPNGLAITAAQDALIVGETRTRRLLRYPLNPDGTAGQPDLFCQLPDSPGGPDGMDFDEHGTLCVAHWNAGVVEVVDADGHHVDRLPTGGERPSNVAFRDRSLYVTEGATGRVIRFDLGVRGQPLYAERTGR